MKRLLFVLSLLVVTLVHAQKKETLKGSKIVTIEQKAVEPFTALEVRDELEVSLIKGDKNGVEIEADDNLHEALGLSYNGSTLILSMAKNISGAKKFSIRVTYTDAFTSVMAKHKSVVNALEEIKLEDIRFDAYDNAKLNLNLSPKSFTISADDRAQVALNGKSESATILVSKNATVKALIAATQFKCDLYQKGEATIEGDVIDMTLRLDNNAGFIGKKLTAKNIVLVAEGYVNCDIWADTTLAVEASGDAEVRIYGEPKMEIRKFADNAKLLKKQMK
ncbi:MULTISPECIES: GIN domain-containing protein [unclassified Flavobacterium]|uniref:GIN domain-containing protein n=1 Tax=unclassified Flavobacterium TaxID=196869 RepID=UPI001F13F15A|nr:MULTISPECIES: DUF2807 domain-containing protein [unclassified Flavobacterium]UMY67159.1 DUF2807 domain-containing protein [Flavobacterium sp. HJ-32-4]